MVNHRPQNKIVVEYDFDGQRSKPFTEFLESCSLSGSLKALVTYAVTTVPMSQGAGRVTI